jgi:hypothetical protein
VLTGTFSHLRPHIDQYVSGEGLKVPETKRNKLFNPVFLWSDTNRVAAWWWEIGGSVCKEKN